MIIITCLYLTWTVVNGFNNFLSSHQEKFNNVNCLSKDALVEQLTGLAPDSAEYLYKQLFGCYNTNARPVKNVSEPVTIHAKIILKSLERIDMRRQQKVVRLVLELKWKDDYLVWDPMAYNNITRFTVKSNKIWLPDVAVESETGSFEFIKPTETGKAVVESTGTVTLWPSAHTSLGTELDVSKYPFDTQIITLIVGSWAYGKEHVVFKLNKNYSPLSSYQNSGEWQMLEFSPVEWEYPYGDITFDRVGFQFTVRRNWQYYAMNVIGPVVIVCLLNLLVFLLPAVCGQRVTLAISICLSLTVFLSQIESSMPKTSAGVSILVVYLFLQIVGSVLTIGVSVLVIYLSQRATTKVQSTSRVLQLCRRVVPRQWLKFARKDSTNISSGSNAQQPEPEKEGACSEDIRPGTSKKGKRNSEIGQKHLLALASEYINRTSLWLALIWNILLFILVVMYVMLA